MLPYQNGNIPQPHCSHSGGCARLRLGLWLHASDHPGGPVVTNCCKITKGLRSTRLNTDGSDGSTWIPLAIPIKASREKFGESSTWVTFPKFWGIIWIHIWHIYNAKKSFWQVQKYLGKCPIADCTTPSFPAKVQTHVHPWQSAAAPPESSLSALPSARCVWKRPGAWALNLALQVERNRCFFLELEKELSNHLPPVQQFHSSAGNHSGPGTRCRSARDKIRPSSNPHHARSRWSLPQYLALYLRKLRKWSLDGTVSQWFSANQYIKIWLHMTSSCLRSCSFPSLVVALLEVLPNKPSVSYSLSSYLPGLGRNKREANPWIQSEDWIWGNDIPTQHPNDHDHTTHTPNQVKLQ